jgi:hypothetical protein
MALDWRNKKTWNVAGTVLTLGWIAFVLARVKEQPDDRLSDLIFIVPIVLWIAIIVATRLLGVGGGPDRPGR